MPSNELERIALQKREELIARNTYNGVSNDHEYTAMHTRAISDTESPEHGKGLGNGTFLDVYGEAGSATDIKGNPEVPGSGRVKNVATNQYDKDKIYEEPDTTGNIGQINF